MELTDRLRKLMDPADKKKLGKEGQTFDEAQSGAWDKLEKELHNQYLGFLRRNGFIEPIHAPMNKKSMLPEGWPDFTVFGGGRGIPPLFIEFKVGKNKLSKEQESCIELLRSMGYTVYVLYTYEESVRYTKAYFGL